MLNRYRAKRSFKHSPEPSGRLKHSKGLPLFVVQKHDATRLHYDFRLEHQGVLLSWAVPKGPSLNPKEKHLAIQVEDHPFDYHDFEGTIPEGNYGAGTVMVWDEGTYSVEGADAKKGTEEAISKGLAKGHLQFTLHGQKLHGAFQLVRLKNDSKKAEWLFFKSKDEGVSEKNVLEESDSVKTGRSLDEIAQRKTKKQRGKLGLIKPMLATSIEKPFTDPDWLFEVKWDGFRALAYIDTSVNLYSRNHNTFNAIFSEIRDDLAQMDCQAVLDGELVVLDAQGRSHFQSIQNYQNQKNVSLIYYVFDLLELNGKDLRKQPLIKRKEMLKKLLSRYALSKVRYSDHVIGKGEAFFKQAQAHNLEGIIAKKIGSIYLSTRSKQWLKLKTQKEQEVVIGGFTAPQGGRKKFGSLLLGVFNAHHELVYVGHVGTGFTDKTLTSLYDAMQPLIQTQCPFSVKPTSKTKMTWIDPKLSCEVSFSEWTLGKTMRHPVFKRLSQAKDAPIKEKPSKTAKAASTVITNPDKVYFPKDHITKLDIVEYYRQIAGFILPYLKNRPMVLRRFPEGIDAPSFVQKNTTNLHLPSFIHTIEIPHEGKTVTYFVIQNLQSLEYVVNLGSIEMHPFHAPISHLDLPDYFILDLDPEGVSFDKVIETALTIHQFLEEMAVPHYCKTSGGRGLHIYIPLAGKYTEEQIAQFGDCLGLMIHERLPKITSLERKPEKRQRKIYIDVLQNRSKQTVAAPYSLRGKPGAPVSTPLHWDELVKGVRPQHFNFFNTLARLEKVGDLFAPILGKGFDIKKWVMRRKKD